VKGLRRSNAAAVDLGSNSFHMVVARLVGDQLSIVDRLRERAARRGPGEKKRLTRSRGARAGCLSRSAMRARHAARQRARRRHSALRVARN
jgi:exopolyphosphatase/guanosine-5'-triphosphate,3'-diphosphate pyrophosphatase